MSHPSANISSGKNLKSRSLAMLKVAVFLLVLFIVSGLDYTLTFYVDASQKLSEKESVRLEMENVGARIENELDRTLYILIGVASYISVRSEITDKEFESLAKELLAESNSLSNIAIAPDFVISNVYPLEGHRQTIGLDYRKNPKQWSEAKPARDQKTMVIAGPIALAQGGEGLAARVPVFTENGQKFWGLTSALFNFKTLLKKSGIVDKPTLVIAIKGRHGKGEEGEVLYGDPSLFENDTEAVTARVTLPNGYWILAAMPKEGWKSDSATTLYIHLLFMVLGLSLYLTITRLYDAKISHEDSANQFKAMSRASHDALIIIDSEDNISLWNPAAEKMFDYSEAEMKMNKMHDVITLESDRRKAYEGLSEFKHTGEGHIIGRVREVTARKKDGSLFPAELSVASFPVKEKWYAVGSIRDVTERKAYENQLTRLATTDSLTNLYNRRHFLAVSEMELSRTKRYKKDLTALMLDIDHFKSVNDTYGHYIGDVVLKSVADSLKNTVRTSDITGRLGGEEFAILLPETDMESAKVIAERIRMEISRKRFPENEALAVTISIGLTEFKPGRSVSDMLKMADQALYQAKQEGRNRVVTLSSR